MWAYLLTHGHRKTLVLLLGDLLLFTGVVMKLAGRLPEPWATPWPPMSTESWLLLGLGEVAWCLGPVGWEMP